MESSVREKGIKQIIHFTRLENLGRILTEGLIPRQILSGTANQPIFNDDYRYDNHPDANCCSISYPNYKMLYRLGQENRDEDWVILGLNPKILWEKDCAYCKTNAASDLVRHTPIEDRKSVEAFNNLFLNAVGKPTRAHLNLPKHWTTDPQAEVLVFDTIEPHYIYGAYCKSLELKRRLDQDFPEFQFKHNTNIFRGRRDYRHWQQ